MHYHNQLAVKWTSDTDRMENDIEGPGFWKAFSLLPRLSPGQAWTAWLRAVGVGHLPCS